MIREFSVLESVGKTSSRTEKIALLSACKTPRMESILRLAYDWRINFYLRLGKNKTRSQVSQGENDEALFGAFTRLCEMFSSRAITGNKARSVLEAFLARTGDSREWYERIINRDLKIGVNESTILKVFPKLLRPFDVQLANVYEPGDPVRFPQVLEPKYDGLRCVVIVRGQDARCFSRQGHEFTSLQDFADMFLPLGDGVYDGEVMGADWNCSVSLARSTSAGDREKAWEGLKYYAFDFIPLLDFDVGVSKVAASQRRQLLIARIDQLGEQDKVELVPQYVCKDTSDIEAHFQRLIEDGFEGVMIKDYNAPYRCKRSDAWLKYKPFFSTEYKVIGVTPGEGRHEGIGIGALVVETEEGVVFNVGTGYSDSVRQDLWRRQNEIVGKFVECKVAERPGQTSGTPTFVSFLRLREDLC